MTMTGTTTIIITVKASNSRPRWASAIGPLGLRTTARSQPPARRASKAIAAQRMCNDSLLHAPARTDD